MRKSIVSLAVGAVLVTAAVSALQAGAFASQAKPAASASDVFAFATTMKSYIPTSAPPQNLPGFAIYGVAHRNGKVIGLSTASCTATHVKKPQLLLCTVDYSLSSGLITTTGYSNNGGASVTLVVTGGTGAFREVRGYGKLQRTNTGSKVTLHLTG
jgi:hypothetical protein